MTDHKPLARTRHDHGERPPANAKLNPLHFSPDTLSAAFNSLALRLEDIRREWMLTDQEMQKWVGWGMTATSGFAQLFGVQGRHGIRHQQNKLRTDVVPFVLPHCDPNLRDRIQRLMRLMDIDTAAVDRYGEETERWRQTWSASGLEEDFAEIIPILKAESEAVLLRRAALGSASGQGAPQPDVRWTKAASLTAAAKWFGFKDPDTLKRRIDNGEIGARQLSAQRWVFDLAKVLDAYKAEATCIGGARSVAPPQVGYQKRRSGGK